MQVIRRLLQLSAAIAAPNISAPGSTSRAVRPNGGIKPNAGPCGAGYFVPLGPLAAAPGVLRAIMDLMAHCDLCEIDRA